jgi:hypothetical protein
VQVVKILLAIARAQISPSRTNWEIHFAVERVQQDSIEDQMQMQQPISFEAQLLDV